MRDFAEACSALAKTRLELREVERERDELKTRYQVCREGRDMFRAQWERAESDAERAWVRVEQLGGLGPAARDRSAA